MKVKVTLTMETDLGELDEGDTKETVIAGIVEDLCDGSTVEAGGLEWEVSQSPKLPVVEEIK